MMRGKKSKTLPPGFSRREFLLTVGATAPTLSLMEGSASGAPKPAPGTEARDAERQVHSHGSERLLQLFLAGVRDPRKGSLDRWGFCPGLPDPRPGRQTRLAGNPLYSWPRRFAEQRLDGAPAPSPGQRRLPAWKSPWGGKRISSAWLHLVTLMRTRCRDPTRTYSKRWGNIWRMSPLFTKMGERACCPFAAGLKPTRVLEPWGHFSFAALPQGKMRTSKITDPLSNALGWGYLQTLHCGRPGGRPRPGNHLGVRAREPFARPHRFVPCGWRRPVKMPWWSAG